MTLHFVQSLMLIPHHLSCHISCTFSPQRTMTHHHLHANANKYTFYVPASRLNYWFLLIESSNVFESYQPRLRIRYPSPSVTFLVTLLVNLHLKFQEEFFLLLVFNQTVLSCKLYLCIIHNILNGSAQNSPLHYN